MKSASAALCSVDCRPAAPRLQLHRGEFGGTGHDAGRTHGHRGSRRSRRKDQLRGIPAPFHRLRGHAHRVAGWGGGVLSRDQQRRVSTRLPACPNTGCSTRRGGKRSSRRAARTNAITHCLSMRRAGSYRSCCPVSRSTRRCSGARRPPTAWRSWRSCRRWRALKTDRYRCPKPAPPPPSAERAAARAGNWPPADA